MDGEKASDETIVLFFNVVSPSDNLNGYSYAHSIKKLNMYMHVSNIHTVHTYVCI